MGKKYVIQKGDTLSEIAQKLKVDMEQLAKANNIKNKRKIFIGQELKLPDSKLPLPEQVSKAMTEAKKFMTGKKSPVPAVQAYNMLVPTNIKQFLYDLSGGQRVITEKDVHKNELESLKNSVLSAKKRGSNIVEYVDHGTTTEPNKYKDVSGQMSNVSLLGKLTDPAYSMKTFIGQGAITENPKGETLVTDRFNYNDAVDGTFMDYLKDARKAGRSIYSQMRTLGRHYGSGPGEGSPVVINLGKL